MHLFSRTFSKNLLIVALIIVTLFVTSQSAHAFVHDFIEGLAEGIAKWIINKITTLINAIITLIAGFFYYIANLFVREALDLNAALIEPQPKPESVASIVKEGHETVLAVANAGFIAALVVIAFATMLKREGFSYKRALPRLFIVALLINFGFFIVTNWLIKPVDQITLAFDKASNFSPELSFQIFKDVGRFDWSSITGAGSGFTSDIGKSIASVIFTAVFHFFGILTLFAFALMLFVRYIALSILIILLPLAWIAWIFPNLRIPGGHPWTIWWESFTRWLLFAPFAMFFFYLAIKLSHRIAAPVPSPGNVGEYIGGVFSIIAILLGGLIVSNRMGISGGAMVLGLAASMKGWVQVQGQRLSHAGGLMVFGSRPLKGLSDRAARAAERQPERSFAGRLIRAPFIAGGRSITRMEERSRNFLLQEAISRISKRTPDNIEREIAGYNEVDQVAALNVMQSKGLLWQNKTLAPILQRLQQRESFEKLGQNLLKVNIQNELGLPLRALDAEFPVHLLVKTEEEGGLTPEEQAELERALEQRRKVIEDFTRQRSTKAFLAWDPLLRNDWNSDLRAFGIENRQAHNILRKFIAKTRVDTREDLFGRLMAGADASGIAFLNEIRELGLARRNQAARIILEPTAAAELAATTRPEVRARIIQENWPADIEEFNRRLGEATRRGDITLGERADYEPFYERGAADFFARYNALAQSRGLLAQFAFEFATPGAPGGGVPPPA